MQKYEKRILQCILAEKIIPIDLKYWPFFHYLKEEFTQQIHMVVLYGKYETSRGAVIVTKDKNVYNIDCNKDFRSMTDHVHIFSYAKKIKELCGKNIQTFAHSWSIVLALTEEGEVYVYKFTKKRDSNQEQSDVPTFIQVASLNYKGIVDIACGNYHFLALTSHGKVYAWRNGNYMLDGNKNIAIFNRRVRQVKRRLKNKNIIYIACGHKFNMVITDENKLYGWGDNYNGQISFDRAQKYYKYPREITTFSENKIVKMVCGFSHTLAITNKGELYAWGDNFYGQLGVKNNQKPSGPIMVNVPQMGKVLNIDAYGNMSIAVGYDRTIYVWGLYFSQEITQPCPTKFSRIFDVFVHSTWKRPNKPLIVHNSLHTVRITNNYNYKNTEKVLNILESLEAAFDDPLTSDLTIQVEGQSIYVHKPIIKIRCQYFFDSISDSLSVYTVSDKFSYVVYKAFLKYLYTSTIDLPLENTLELMELAEMYCKTNLKKDCSQIIKQTITVSNVGFFYNKAIEYNAKELEEFCFQFASRHMTDDTLSEDYNKLNISTQAKCKHRTAIENNAITPFYSSNKNIQKTNSETSTNKNRVADLSDNRIVNIGCGRHYGLALTSDGKVYEWEKKNWEEKNWNKNYSKESDSEVNDSEESDLEESDWEENDSRIGIENTAYFSVPWQNDVLVKVVCGDRHTLALTSKGEVYAWGDNNCGQIGVNSNGKPSGPTVINVPEMRKVLDIAACRNVSVAIGYDRIIYVWGHLFLECCTSIPFPTKFSNIYDAFAHSMWRIRHNSLIVFTNNFNVEEVLGTLESLRAIFDDPELEEFCFYFAVHHMKAVVLSEEYIKLDTSTKDNFMRRAAKGNIFRI
ncbi:RCC1 and BTB domain-containing protein 1 [Camponotus floridanus]|uniref:RCC1 and BTB domain-containing protein 1 n=1 Tax=Camponotus floridanus TaxID=104421 RepID=E2A4G7_CAMFO|nr:RCC1 and BTB domain-containing protein 1 [Camponotus floridanus]